ncbi:MAG: hypothetical protein JXB49_01745 [Bacteroidales bacterium]|nr:hypothetical protein [Bacteroidales bacterium]
MSFYKSYWSVIIFLFHTLILLGQENYYGDLRFNYITIDEGLANNKVNSICQDKYGFMWFGSDDGLNRYDGHTMLTVYPYIEDSSFAGSYIIFTLFSDSKGRLWVGLKDYLALYDEILGKYKEIKYRNIRLERIRDFYEDKAGNVWICSGQGLFYVGSEDDTVHSYSAEHEGFNQAEVFSFYIDSWGNHWIGTRDNGLFYHPGKSKKYYKVNETNNYRIENIIQDFDSTIWICTYNNNLFRFHYKDSVFYPVIINKDDPYTVRTRAIVTDKQGNLWFGTRGGLYMKPYGKEDFKLVGHPLYDQAKISSYSVFTIFIDKSDVLWLGTFAGGVNYADLHQKKFHNIVQGSNNQAGLSDGIVFAVIEDQKERIWAGTANGGLNRIDLKTGKIDHLLKENYKPGRISLNIHALEISGDNLYFGTFGDGLGILNINTEKATFVKGQGEDCQLKSNNIYSLRFDRNGKLWIGTDGGLYSYSKSCFSLNLEINDLVNVLLMDSKGYIWAGTFNNGLFVNKGDGFKRVRQDKLKGSITAILEDSNGKIWCGGQNTGLIYFDDDTIYKYSAKQGLTNNTVYGILEDDSKNLWVSTSFGLFKMYDIVNNPLNPYPLVTYYDRFDGIVSNQFIYASYSKTSSGNLVFGNIKGITYFNPKEIEVNSLEMPVLITDLYINNTPVNPGQVYNNHIILANPIYNTDHLILYHNENHFTISFASMHYVNPGKHLFKYILEGFDNEWHITDASKRYATYTNLNGGNYIFKVYAANHDGIWSHEPAILQITIIPPFWKTWWFKILTILTCITIILWVYYLRSKQIEIQKRKLKKIVELRTSEINEKNTILQSQTEELTVQKEKLLEVNNQLEELNITKDKFYSIIAHDLKNPFQSITGFSELLKNKYDHLNDEKRLKYIDLIYSTSNHAYNLLENLLQWTRSHTGKIEFVHESIVPKVIVDDALVYLQSQIEKKEIKAKNKVPSTLKILADRNSIYTIFRNLISNATKYSYTKGAIEISFDKNGMDNIFSVKDYGEGMDEKTLLSLFLLEKGVSKKGTDGETGTGLGLLICKEFVEKHGGKIWAESTPGRGSTFYFKLPDDPAGNSYSS